MLRKSIVAVSFALLAAPTAFADPPVASDPSAHTYQGNDGRYYQDCKKSSGTTGALAGAGAGGLGAAALGAGPVGLAAGVIGGGLLGRHLDKKHDEAQNEKNGC